MWKHLMKDKELWIFLAVCAAQFALIVYGMYLIWWSQ